MSTGQIKSLRALAGLLLAAWLGLGGLGQAGEVSAHGNSWVWVSIGPVVIKAEAVSTPERLYRGLSHRRALPEGQGMLFLMPAKEVQSFCMRGMKFPLDFIWIDAGQVAGLTRNVPSTFPGDLISPVPVQHVLEVPGGFVKKYGIQVGDPVTWR
jgi:uncharacterized membrane protein (UPF0127 family)